MNLQLVVIPSAQHCRCYVVKRPLQSKVYDIASNVIEYLKDNYFITLQPTSKIWSIWGAMVCYFRLLFSRLSISLNVTIVLVFQEGNFAARKCGRLKEGQVLLQVDGTPLTGMTSGVAVLTLRHAYSDSASPVLKLLIRDV